MMEHLNSLALFGVLGAVAFAEWIAYLNLRARFENHQRDVEEWKRDMEQNLHEHAARVEVVNAAVFQDSLGRISGEVRQFKHEAFGAPPETPTLAEPEPDRDVKPGNIAELPRAVARYEPQRGPGSKHVGKPR